MKKEKQDLFYACTNGTIDIIVGNHNYIYWDLECVKRDYPESDYNYIEVEGDVE